VEALCDDAVYLFFRSLVCRLWNLLSHSPGGSTWWQVSSSIHLLQWYRVGCRVESVRWAVVSLEAKQLGGTRGPGSVVSRTTRLATIISAAVALSVHTGSSLQPTACTSTFLFRGGFWQILKRETRGSWLPSIMFQYKNSAWTWIFHSSS